MGERLKAQAIVFDLDGTLVHSGPDLAFAANRMLRALEMVPYQETKIFDWLGNGANKLVKRVLTGQQDGEPEQRLFDRGYELFMQFYQEGMCDRSAPYPHVMTVLGKLQNEGFRLACLTNKPEAFTKPLLTTLGLYDYFEHVISGDNLPKKKPDPMPLNYICKRFDAPHHAVVVVGDSMSDIRAAQAARMPIICVSYGYNQGVDLTKACPDAIIDSFKDLPDLVEYQC